MLTEKDSGKRKEMRETEREEQSEAVAALHWEVLVGVKRVKMLFFWQGDVKKGKSEERQGKGQEPDDGHSQACKETRRL